jgi:hypothetical protein
MGLLPESVHRVDGVTSDAGLFDALETAGQRSTVLHFDELGFLLRMTGEHLSGSTLDSMLNRLWSAPKFLDRHLSRSKPTGGQRRLERPFVCLLGGTHPESFWLHLGDARLAIASGFVNRLAVFAVERARSLPLTAAPDPAMGRQLRAHLEQLVKLGEAEVRLEARAEALWREFSHDHDERLGRFDLTRAAVVKRVRDHVARLALVFAVDVGRNTIAEEDLAVAIEVGGYLEASYVRLLLGRQADRGPGRAASLEHTARALLARLPRVWHTARNLQRGWPNQGRPSSEELRRVLRAMDGVEIDPAQGKRKERYRWSPRAPSRHTTRNPSESKGRSVECRIGAPEGGRAV